MAKLQPQSDPPDTVNSMSFSYYLSLLIPPVKNPDPIFQRLHGNFNSKFSANIPKKLGRSIRAPSHSKEYLALLSYSVISSSGTKKPYNTLPSIHSRTSWPPTSLSPRALSTRKLNSKAPGVIRVFPKLGRMLVMSSTHTLISPRKQPLSTRTGFPTHKRSITVLEGLHEEFLSEHNSLKSYSGELEKGLKHGKGTAVYANGDEYSGGWSIGKQYGVGTFQYNSLGLRYKGEWEEGLRHGQGTLFFPNGDKIKGTWNFNHLKSDKVTFLMGSGWLYCGQFSNGLRQGVGTCDYKELGNYVGSWNNDNREGTGVVNSKKFFFEGMFKNDTTDGAGVLVHKSGLKQGGSPSAAMKKAFEHLHCFKGFSSLQLTSGDIVYMTLSMKDFSRLTDPPSAVNCEPGKFQAGKLNGVGIAKYGDFGCYVGNFVQGKRSGWGTMVYTDPGYHCVWTKELEGEYRGLWLNDQRQGYGTMKWPTGMDYEGTFNRDLRDQVTGKIHFVTGEEYTGGWVNCLLEGKGTVVLESGLSYRGQFSQGKAGELGELRFSDGGSYEGTISGFEPHGEGKRVFANGDVYEGGFSRGEFHGKGRMWYQNKDYYKGLWGRGLKCEGVMRYAEDNLEYEGQWEEDKREGLGVLREIGGRVIYKGEWTSDTMVNSEVDF